MSENIVTTLQERPGLSHFENIAPNEPQRKRDLLVNPKTDHYTRGAVIAGLMGINKYGFSTNGAAVILTHGVENNLFENLFGDKEKDVV